MRDRDWGWEEVFRVGFRAGAEVLWGYEFSMCMKRKTGDEKRGGEGGEMMNYDVMIGWDWI